MSDCTRSQTALVNWAGASGSVNLQWTMSGILICLRLGTCTAHTDGIIYIPVQCQKEVWCGILEGNFNGKPVCSYTFLLASTFSKWSWMTSTWIGCLNNLSKFRPVEAYCSAERTKEESRQKLFSSKWFSWWRKTARRRLQKASRVQHQEQHQCEPQTGETTGPSVLGASSRNTGWVGYFLLSRAERLTLFVSEDKARSYSVPLDNCSLSHLDA